MARLFAVGARPQIQAWSLALDAVIAVAASALAIDETITHAYEAAAGYPSVWLLAGAALMVAPLAIRRVYPVTACAIIFATAASLPHHVPPVAFGAAILAVYAAVAWARWGAVPPADMLARMALPFGGTVLFFALIAWVNRRAARTLGAKIEALGDA